MTIFTTSRLIPAPPEAVFAALAAPVRLAKWWGPAGFSNTFSTFEFTTGGAWLFTMHGPDGQAYPNEASFTAITPNIQVVIQHENQPRFVLTITLEAQTGGTKVLWEQVFEDAAIAEAVRHIVEPANEQNLDRWTAEVLI